jgi:transposase
MLYDTKQPTIFIRLTGQPLVGATRYEQEALRCSACQERFTAPLPAGVKQDPLAGLQESVGAPLPESIQFERCEAVADAALPVFLYLRRLAADGEVIYSNDTRVKILSISFSSLRK